MRDNAAAPDGELVGRVCQGDLAALGELYNRHGTQVFRTALAITRNKQMAEDVLQEVFLKLHRYAKRVDTSLPLAPWLYRVTANLCYSHFSRQKRWFVALEDVIENIAAPSSRSCPERQAEKNELQSVIQQAIGRLSPNHQIVIVLHYLAGLSLKEIAEILEIPEGTVKSRLHYGRESLRDQLETKRTLLPGVAYEFT
jgi:RNA polymerase sigma-70 factor (ECF subfamily)